MAYFVEIYCRLAIRLCVGYQANGRERYRTVNIWGVRRDATAEQVALFVRALEPLLEGRVVRVRLIRKDRLVVDGVVGRGAAGDHWSPLHSGIITDTHPRPEILAARDGTRHSPLQRKTITNVGAGSARPPSSVAPFTTSRRTRPAFQTARTLRLLRAPPYRRSPFS